jgi:hypothetical protein
MNNKKLIRFTESFLVLPIITMLTPFGTIPTDLNNSVVQAPQTVLSQQSNTVAQSLLALNQADNMKAQILQKQADAIDAYFKKNNMPLEGTGMLMAKAADENALDYRLLPAIAARESTGGRDKCKDVEHSFFGWGSCKISFKSDEEAIETVANNLGGNNPDTEQRYAGKTTREILNEYNSTIKGYTKQVLSIMNDIGDAPTVQTSNV